MNSIVKMYVTFTQNSDGSWHPWIWHTIPTHDCGKVFILTFPVPSELEPQEEIGAVVVPLGTEAPAPPPQEEE